MQLANGNKEHKGIKVFTDLYAWQEGHKLVMEIYAITKLFPREEVFGLSSQIRRSGISITSNLAEGFGRTSEKEKVQFYSIARGSVTETQNQLLIAKGAGYISEEKSNALWEQSIIVHKLVNGLIRKIKQTA